MAGPRRNPQYDTTQEDVAGFTGERANVTEGETKERLFPGECRDAVYLDPETLAEMGITGAIPTTLVDTAKPGDRVYMCIRAPKVFGKIEPGRQRTLKRRWKTAEYVMTADNEPEYQTDDTVLITVSREEYMQKRVARHVAAAEQFTRGLIDGRVASESEEQAGLVEDFGKYDERRLREEKEWSRRTLAGMKSNCPKGMSLEEFEIWMTKDDPMATINIEREAARGGRSERKGEYEDWEKRQREKVAKMKKDRTRSFSFPAGR